MLPVIWATPCQGSEEEGSGLRVQQDTHSEKAAGAATKERSPGSFDPSTVPNPGLRSGRSSLRCALGLFQATSELARDLFRMSLLLNPEPEP